MPDLYCNGIESPIHLSEESLLPSIADFMGSWPLEVVPESVERSPVISIQLCGGNTYQIVAPWLSSPLHKNDLTELLCNFSVDLVIAYLTSNPESVGIHAAAVHYSGGLAIFPNKNRSGKSLLTANFMARGDVVYGDDLIALTPDGNAMSFGLPPRLRLPLPQLVSSVKTFIRDNLAFSNNRYGFLNPKGACRALFKQEAKIDRIIFLERQEKGKPILSQVSREVGLRDMVNRCLLLRREQALTALNLCEKIIKSASVWRIFYAHAHEAVEVLAEELCPSVIEGNIPCKADPRSDLFKFNSSGAMSLNSLNKNLGRLYVRNKGVVCRKKKNGIFLVEQNTGAIFHLNHMGRLIWNFLEDPISVLEIAELLCSVFSTPKEIVLRDVSELFEALQAEDLISAFEEI